MHFFPKHISTIFCYDSLNFANTVYKNFHVPLLTEMIQVTMTTEPLLSDIMEESDNRRVGANRNNQINLSSCIIQNMVITQCICTM